MDPLLQIYVIVVLSYVILGIIFFGIFSVFAEDDNVEIEVAIFISVLWLPACIVLFGRYIGTKIKNR